MAWCEANRIDFLFGPDRNARLIEELASDLALAEHEAGRTGRPVRRFRDFRWSTLDSWSRGRRVVGKAEWTRGKANPRIVVASLTPTEADARTRDERLYCARGEMENRIKEYQLDLFPGRASAATMRANQLRLWFASMAYVLLCALRLALLMIGAHGTQKPVECMVRPYVRGELGGSSYDARVNEGCPHGRAYPQRREGGPWRRIAPSSLALTLRS